jgi:hypothetical protein
MQKTDKSNVQIMPPTPGGSTQNSVEQLGTTKASSVDGRAS